MAIALRRDGRLQHGVVEDCSVTQLCVWIQTNLQQNQARGTPRTHLVSLSRRDESGMRALTCGSRGVAGFTRRDGLGLSFEFNVWESKKKECRVVSYALQVITPGNHPLRPSFLRWEYTQKRKAGVDALREPLAHLHPNNNDIRIPTQILTPKELIAQMLELTWGL